MIIVSKTKLKFLIAGRTYDIPVPNPHQYRLGRDYAISTSHRKPHTHRVQILQVNQTTIRIRLATIREPVRLLARYSQYGYTNTPSRAMRHEPEAVPASDIERLARTTHDRREAEIPLADRLQALERRAAGGDRQAKRDLFVVQQRLQIPTTQPGTVVQ